MECSSSDGDDEDGGIDVYRFQFDTNRSDNSFECPASSSSVHTSQQIPSSSVSTTVNPPIKVECFLT